MPDWVNGFRQYAAAWNTTPLYARWAGLWAVGMGVTRQVVMRAHGNLISPNLYVHLVGGPGTGKGQSVKALRSVLIPAGTHSFMPSSITKASLEEYLKDNLMMRPPAIGTVAIPTNECIGLSDELQGILPEHDVNHLTFYNELYDLLDLYFSKTISRGEIKLESPYCAILTGSQPAYYATSMPEQGWGMGFMSRSIMVFDSKPARKSAFTDASYDTVLRDKLKLDFQHLSKLSGVMTWTREAKALYETWWVEHGGPPVPEAKRLAMGYNARREIHFFKMAMCFSLARSDELKVTFEDASAAIELLLLTEDRMRHIFTEMVNAGTVTALGDLADYVKRKWSTLGEPTHEADIMQMLLERFPAQQTRTILENMLMGGLLAEEKPGLAPGFRKFVPGKRLAGV